MAVLNIFAASKAANSHRQEKIFDNQLTYCLSLISGGSQVIFAGRFGVAYELQIPQMGMGITWFAIAAAHRLPLLGPINQY